MTIRKHTVASLISMLLAVLSPLNFAASGPYNMGRDGIVRYEDVFHPVVGRSAMVATQNALASDVGVQILEAGGNAVDAAVAIGFALAVTLPRAGNLGGGGFMLVHRADGKKTVAIDYRETAPSGVSAADFLNSDGSKNRATSRSWHAIGVPGTVAGLHRAWRDHGSGKLSWSQLLQPAITLAVKGFVVNYDLAQLLQAKSEWLRQDTATAKAYFKADGSSYRAGETLLQADLAWSLEQIAKHGPKAFYQGAIADKIVAAMQRQGGHIDREDLAGYTAKYRTPVVGDYRGYQVVSMPPPSSGGVAIIETLNILEQFPLTQWGRSAQTFHVMAEAMKRSFADRGQHLADPDFYPVPQQWLIDKKRAGQLATTIKLDRATSSEQLGGHSLPEESPSTTHFSVIDAEGNAVSNTYTLANSFGTGHMVEGTGILMNNQVYTFSVQADVEGAAGFSASKANRLEPGKRPVSSQSPTIVLKEGKPFLLVGSPGGSRIINVVTQVISNVIDHKMNIAEATNERRIHHQWLPDILEVEPGFNRDSMALLRAKGHRVEETRTMGSSQSIMVHDGYYFGASDPRRPNAKTVGLD
ncbi:gamma-glutamyltransferase [Microbulbifer sp. SSSA002]|uniref:gamma-glutamyltransferase n=1 Tax=Microbulbifer sp. SSSA002 TaxID=3243376 RepID=UPI004039DF16